MKAAIVCNSINPDLVQYFKVITESTCKNDFLFLTAKSNRISNAVISTSSNDSFVSVSFFRDILKIPYITRLLFKKRCKYVHFTTAHLLNIPQALTFKLIGAKMIFTIHDLEPHPGFKRVFIGLYNRFTLSLGSKILVHNQAYVKKIGKKAYYVPLSGFDHSDRAKSFTKELLFFGRMETYKGLGNLVDLATRMQKQAPDWSLRVVGKGRSKYLEQLKNFENTTVRNEFVSEDELNEIIGKSSFVVIPYDSATQSGVVVKSFSVNTPVIAYNVGSLAEYIDDGITGFLVDHGDNRRIIQLLDSISVEGYLEQADHVRERFLKYYSNHAFERYLFEFYSKVINS